MEPTKDRKWYRTSLRLMGDALPMDEIANRLGFEPSFSGRTGEHIRGNPRYAKYKTNIWGWSMNTDTTVEFEQQIDQILDILEPKKLELLKILALPNVQGELFLGFSSSEGQGGAYFSSSLLSRVATLGLALDLDLYPPGKDNDELKQTSV